MFLKQYNYKPRSGSGSDGTSGSAIDTSSSAAAANNTASTDTSASAVANQRRRSSATEKFAGLSAHKRGSADQNVADRKASFADQKPGGAGVIGSMWNSFTKGS